jgi:tRNA threonylcarbamoyladenosine biosynthesis protein TsaB
VLVLAFDTSGAVMTLALVEVDHNGHRNLVDRCGDGKTGHSALLAPMVAEVLNETGVAAGDLELIACGRGPGSFTGLRTGLALAKGLAMGIGRPVVGLGSLTILAAASGPLETTFIAPVIDARHREVFTALYRFELGRLEPVQLTEILVIEPGKVMGVLSSLVPLQAKVILTGPGTNLLPEPVFPFEFGGESAPSAEILAILAVQRLADGQLSPSPASPLYGRSPDIFKTWTPPVRLVAGTTDA